ncbi:hemerythrin domain-containing protein [Yinghuangia sp. KLBMP8922]|uniref:Hemerythrin domain-containing protein n=2 Tax=Yinghuangia soli TaxID=2908204 RepID=A0AA41Q9J1_9ACTN|nr:hemerythrin domain-containing protein [Yinghuangia soli]
MTGPEATRAEAARLHRDDVVGILLDQHARIEELFADVKHYDSGGPAKRRAFDELRCLLAVHEAAEEMVVRPAAKKVAGTAETDARNREEKQAAQVLAELEDLDVSSAEFAVKFASLEAFVKRHAELEERQEFPNLRDGYTPEERRTMGSRLRAAEKFAPTHAHPGAAGSTTAAWTVGPFAAMVDQAKDALRTSSSGR